METVIKEPVSEYTIRFQDCDPMGHLNNARFIDYIINAREDHLLLHYQLSLSDYLQRGFGWVVIGHEIQNRKPAMYNEKVKIRTALLEFSDTDLLVEGRVMDETETHLKALLWTRFVFVNTRTGKKEKHSDELLRFFERVCVNGSPVSFKERLQQYSELMKSK
jgi:YbgC/YbaW family acyl-CoA thioester hydrolase